MAHNSQVKRSLVTVLAVVAAFFAVAQAKPTDAQLVGKWSGKYSIDFSKLPADKRPPANQEAAIKKQIEAATFTITMNKDKTAKIANTNAGKTSNVDAVWVLSGADITVTPKKADGKVIPPGQAKGIKFRVAKLDKASLVMNVLNSPVPTTLTLKKV